MLSDYKFRLLYEHKVVAKILIHSEAKLRTLVQYSEIYSVVNARSCIYYNQSTKPYSTI